MLSVEDLQAAQCILLAASLAAEASIPSFRSLARSRRDCLDINLVLRILLTYLPETVEPSIYTSFLTEVAGDEDFSLDDDAVVDCGPVAELRVEELRKRLGRLHLLPLRHPSLHLDAPDDPLTLFLIHRSHRIDSETGLFPLVAPLLEPFFSRSTYLCHWYVGVVLPHLRLHYEYYQPEGDVPTLAEFEDLQGSTGVSTLLGRAQQVPKEDERTGDIIARDLRGVLAPWVYGHRRWTNTSGRNKRRRLESNESGIITHTAEPPSSELGTEDSRDSLGWQLTSKWLVSTAAHNLPLAVSALEGWGGPIDVDFGGDEELRNLFLLKKAEAEELQRDYCRTAFASIYAAEADTSETIDCAHSILVRISELLEFEPPPELATSIHLLPRVDRQKRKLEDPAMSFLQPETLMAHDNPITDPRLESYSLLQLLIYSAYQFSGLGHKTSIVKLAKLRFWSDETEQLTLLLRIVDALLQGARTEDQWIHVRDTCLWLWDWAINAGPETEKNGCGVLGKISRARLEKEMLKLLCKAGQFRLVRKLYLGSGPNTPLSQEAIERTIIEQASQYYDEASNGNRTRGSMKKAADLIAVFKPEFPGSPDFTRFNALVAATHSMSAYSLTLQRGVPFKPLEIRKSIDPVSLLDKILEQNPGSYTQLDALVEIGFNLTRACPPDSKPRNESQGQSLLAAERRIMSMAIEAALTEDDFETAYSYVVNRLTPANNSAETTTDDFSWRAAYLAGRQRPAVSAKGTSGTSMSTSPQVRRLEQRMELLSQSLLLAPSTALPEVLAAWRRCEEELLTVLVEETEQEQKFDDYADRGEVNPGTPGSFGRIDNGFMIQPRRKELGRGTVEEAPMGLFDVARGAAAAFQRSAAGQRQKTSSEGPGHEADGGFETSGRQRKRDMVTSAVTGGLASGLGWMLGATPVKEQDG